MNTVPQDENVLHFLSDLPFHISPGADIRGKGIHDQAGKPLGRVHDLVVSNDYSRVLFVEVESRSLFSHRKYLVPVDQIVVRGKRGLFVRDESEETDAMPWQCPDLIGDSCSVRAAATK